MRSSLTVAVMAFVLASISLDAQAQKYTGPGVTLTEIKIGQTIPYSGPLSSNAIIGRVEGAYLKKINDSGGINGRKVTMISLDDGYSPPKTVEQTRKLVEDEEVLAIVAANGTPTNLATAKYLNGKKIPQILSVSGSSRLDDPKSLPWTTTFFPSQAVEGKALAAYILKSNPNAKIGVLYQNDDFGKGYLNAFKAGLGDKASTMIVQELSSDVGEPTVDSQILTLKASGADTLFQAVNAKAGAQAIRKAYELGWKVQHVLLTTATSIPTVLRPAGLEASTGAVAAFYAKEPGDPTWESDPAMKEYYAFMKEYLPGETMENPGGALGYSLAQMMVHILKNCGDDLSRENVLKQATNIRDVQLPLFLPGVTINIAPDDRTAWHQARMGRFDGSRWVYLDDVITVK